MNARTRNAAIRGLAMMKLAQTTTEPGTTPPPNADIPPPNPATKTTPEQRQKALEIRRRNAKGINKADQNGIWNQWLWGLVSGPRNVDSKGNSDAEFWSNLGSGAADFGKNLYTGTATMGAGILNGAMSLPGFAGNITGGIYGGLKGLYNYATDKNYSFSDVVDSIGQSGRDWGDFVDNHIGIAGTSFDLAHAKRRVNSVKNDLTEDYYKRNDIDPNNKGFLDTMGTLGLSTANVAGEGIGMMLSGQGLGAAAKGFGAGVGAVAQGAGNVVNSVNRAAESGNVLARGAKAVASGAQKVYQPIKSVAGTMGEGAKAVGQSVGNMVRPVASVVSKPVTYVTRGVQKAWKPASNYLKNHKTVGEGLKTTGQTLGNFAFGGMENAAMTDYMQTRMQKLPASVPTLRTDSTKYLDY